MTSTELSQLQVACNRAHGAYREARKALAVAVNKTPDDAAIAELVTSTQELGLNATLKRLTTSDPKVADAIARLVDADDNLSRAVTAREAQLLKNNPQHQRAFVDDGREFTLDMEKGIWTYLDDPMNPIKVKVEKMAKLPYDFVELEPQLLNTPIVDEDDNDEPSRRKKRRR